MTGLGDHHVRKALHEWKGIAQVLREQGYHDVSASVEEAVLDAMRDRKNSKIIILNDDENIVVREAEVVAKGLKETIRSSV